MAVTSLSAENRKAPDRVLFLYFASLNDIAERLGVFSENKLYQQHIADCAAGDGQQHLPLPKVETCRDQNAQQLRQSVTAGQDADIFQAVDHQHTEKCCRKCFAQILYVAGSGPFAGK